MSKIQVSVIFSLLIVIFTVYAAKNMLNVPKFKTNQCVQSKDKAFKIKGTEGNHYLMSEIRDRVIIDQLLSFPESEIYKIDGSMKRVDCPKLL